ncbi:glycosyltransferase family 4 protein [Vulgatibacter incomptus]|uniref:Glycosyl transferase, group 1 n=1 Tax=Vulgatibacter incomptus TaxID=1391653 RepID=A0A0K1P9P9_9BACT|nr:glycosyltransferase family 4 protein [Vulgatibacter incomptus]AKU89839.1 glycosyl transferase, group 1 [Vulgatibacter incomptus]
MSQPLEILFVSSFPASPPTFGAQRRIDGLMRSLSRRHRVSFVSLLPPDLDAERAERAMKEYCRDVVFVPWAEASGLPKRLAQLRSLVSIYSYERRYMNGPDLQLALGRLLRSRRFDLVSVETPFQAFSRLRQAPSGAPSPCVLIDAHNVEFDLARQYFEQSAGLARRLHHEVNWRKLQREELAAWRAVDGVAFTSPDDEARARALVPAIRSAIVPNGVDVEQFRPAPEVPPSGTRTIVFFGTMDYFPNLDAVRWLFREIWPLLSQRDPDLRLKIIGASPPSDVLAHQGPRVDIAGLVDDLQRHLVAADAIIVPLRVGGGTRLKILESLAMGKAVISTKLGAEGIAARSGEHLLIADEPKDFAEAVHRVLEDRSLARELGRKGRELVERRYAWSAIGEEMERFVYQVIEGAPGAARRAS